MLSAIDLQAVFEPTCHHKHLVLVVSNREVFKTAKLVVASLSRRGIIGNLFWLLGCFVEAWNFENLASAAEWSERKQQKIFIDFYRIDHQKFLRYLNNVHVSARTAEAFSDQVRALWQDHGSRMHLTQLVLMVIYVALL